MLDTHTEDMITAAADWWVKAIERPKFDNGDDSAQGGLAAALAMIGNRPKSDQDLDKFREIFIGRMRVEAEQGHAPRIISVDYGPDMWLSEVAEQAGIGTGINDWPWKTSMRFEDGKVLVRAGYAAASKTIFPVSLTEQA